MGDPRYIGRIGLLAAVLGIGIAGGGGVAWASPDDADPVDTAASASDVARRPGPAEAPHSRRVSRSVGPQASPRPSEAHRSPTRMPPGDPASQRRTPVVSGRAETGPARGDLEVPLTGPANASAVTVTPNVPTVPTVPTVRAARVDGPFRTAALAAVAALRIAPTPSMAVTVAAPATAAGLRLLDALSTVDSPWAWGMVAAARGQTARATRVRAGARGAVNPTTSGAVNTPGEPVAAPDWAPEAAPDEVLIGWNPAAGDIAGDATLSLAGAQVIERLDAAGAQQYFEGTGTAVQPGQEVYRLTLPGGVDAAMLALAGNPAVTFVEPNYRVSLGAVANDPGYTGGSLWGMFSDDSPTAFGPAGTTNQFGCGAEDAWGQGFTGSRNVYVAVLDEGIQITHPELAANIWVNPGERPGDGIDNDGNGYVDDVNGWDFYHNDNTVYDAGQDAHGTHVAGTIGAIGGNGAGVAGVCWNVTIIPTKFLGPDGGYISDAARALDYLVDLKKRYNINLVAVNNSWGGGGYSTTMHSAILRAAKAGILFVAAAGNSSSNNDMGGAYPSNYSSLQGTWSESAASYESVIAVASITSSGNLSSFSSYGATTVDLGAPGSGVLSTVPTNAFASYSGTSMATPHVTGAIALYSSANPTATAAQLRTAILGNVKQTPSLSGLTATGGRLSLEGLFSAVPPPAPLSTYDPRLVSISPASKVLVRRTVSVPITVGNSGNTGVQVNVTLTASAGTPGAPVTVYVPAGGMVTTAISWRAPSYISNVTLKATTTLASPSLVDADLTNNSKTAGVIVRYW